MILELKMPVYLKKKSHVCHIMPQTRKSKPDALNFWYTDFMNAEPNSVYRFFFIIYLVMVSEGFS